MRITRNRENRGCEVRRRPLRSIALVGSAVLGAGGLFGVALGSAGAATLNAWTSAGTLGTARAGATATVLANGGVLLAGGTTGTVSTDTLATTAELYSLSSNAWTATASGAPVVANAVSALLPNGNVLVAGGSAVGGTATNLAAIYDPTTNVWSAAAAMPSGDAVFGASAVTLQNGSILVVGGDTGTLTAPVPSALVSIYTPTTGAWTAMNTMATARAFLSATLLGNGNVLVAGGQTVVSSTATVATTAEVYSPTQNTWSAAGALVTPRSNARSALLPSGQVLLVGGQNAAGTAISNAELYTPATNSWSATGSLATARTNAVVTALPTGQVIAAGGSDGGSNTWATTEFYSPAVGTWAAGAS